MKFFILALLVSIQVHADDCKFMRASNIGREFQKGYSQLQLDNEAMQFGVIKTNPKAHLQTLNGIPGYKVKHVSPMHVQLKSGYYLAVDTYEICQ